MLVAPGEFNDLGDLGFRDVVSENAADTHAMAMNVQHYLHGSLAALAEDLFENVHDELHRRVVVVEDEHLVQAGFLGFWPCFGDDAGARVTVPRSLTALTASVTSVFHCRSLQTYMGICILVDKGPKQSPATGYRERRIFRIKKKRAREI